MVVDYQISADDFNKLLREYQEAIHIADRRDFQKEGQWIRYINSVINALKEIDGEVAVVEVIPKIREEWKVKWKGTKGRNPGKKKPISVRKVVNVQGENRAELWILSKSQLQDDIIQKIEELKNSISNNNNFATSIAR